MLRDNDRELSKHLTVEWDADWRPEHSFVLFDNDGDTIYLSDKEACALRDFITEMLGDK